MPTENNLTFDENKYKIKSRVILGQMETPGMIKFLIQKGIVKNEKTAQGILIAAACAFLLVSVYVFAVFVFDVKLFDKAPVLTPELIQAREERMQKIKEQRQNNINVPQNPQ